MDIVFTRHAKGRMRWRRISRHDVERVISSPLRKEKIGPRRFHYFGRLQTRLIRVTISQEQESLIIITVVEK